jgi:hypothetical protein
MRNLIVMIAFSYLLMSCNAQNKQELKKENTLVLSKTKWEYQVAEGFKDYILFDKESCGYSKEKGLFNYCEKKGKYVEYSSELDYPHSGTYEVKNDTIYLTEIDLVNNLPETTEKEIKVISKMVLINDRLTTVYRKRKRGDFWDEKWIENPEIFFKKVN